jgi:hypothetical protein
MGIAKWMFKNKGLRTRLYSADGGIETVEAEGLIEDGIVEAWQISAEQGKSLYICDHACDGWWPKDPKRALNEKDNLLLKPDLAAYAAKFGLTVYEGLTFMSDWMLEDLGNRAAKGEKIGQDSPMIVVDGDRKFGGNPPAHFGFVQRRMEANIEKSRQLPGWVQWTAHERKAEDRELGPKETEFGPDVCGSALTTKVGAHFGNTIHLHPVKKLVKVKDTVTGLDTQVEQVHYRAYTRKHYDPMQRHYITYYANNRMPVSFRDDMPEFLEPPDPVLFYTILETARTKQRAAMAPQGAQKINEFDESS